MSWKVVVNIGSWIVAVGVAGAAMLGAYGLWIAYEIGGVL